jgi:CBS domain-containing protein
MENTGTVHTPEPAANRLLAAYNALDDFMRRALKKGPELGHKKLIEELATRNSMFARHRYDLETFARLRNAIVHTHMPEAMPIAEPHEGAVTQYEQMVEQLLHPPLALSIAVGLANIFTTDWTDPVHEVVAIMNRRDYTHVPILQDGVVAGVFSENTLFSYLAGCSTLRITEKTLVQELRDFLPIDRHASEVFDFLKPTATSAELLDCFRRTFATARRLGAVFITDDGTSTGKLLGLATAWDIAGADSTIPLCSSGPQPIREPGGATMPPSASSQIVQELRCGGTP